MLRNDCFNEILQILRDRWTILRDQKINIEQDHHAKAPK